MITETRAQLEMLSEIWDDLKELEYKVSKMKGLDNNVQSVQTLNNLKGSLDNRIHEIYNQGYKEGYKDGVTDTMQKIADSILAETESEE